MIICKYYYIFCVISAEGSWILLKLLKLFNKISTNVRSLPMKWQFVVVQLGFSYTFLFEWWWFDTRRSNHFI
jgi:succinate dehydrogenase/fumarate reductase cytochrome b subunit